MTQTIQQRTEFVRREARHLGFTQTGFARAGHMVPETDRLKEWLDAGLHGEMDYMENHFNLRTDPTQLVPDARTVISLSFNYYTVKRQLDPEAPVVSTYAFGRDYHKIIRKKLKKLLNVMGEHLGPVKGRGFVDSAPVLERAWAQRSGLGWIGKNTMLIHPRHGSYFFLAELIVDMEFEYDATIRDHCGTCRRCIEACPTGAIDIQGYVLHAEKCISYATIEKKGPIPKTFKGRMQNRVFGCDICMEICPWNRFAVEHEEAAFKPKEAFLSMDRDQWMKMEEDQYDHLFAGTPVKRAKFRGIRRNIDFLGKERDAF